MTYFGGNAIVSFPLAMPQMIRGLKPSQSSVTLYRIAYVPAMKLFGQMLLMAPFFSVFSVVLSFDPGSETPSKMPVFITRKKKNDGLSKSFPAKRSMSSVQWLVVLRRSTLDGQAAESDAVPLGVAVAGSIGNFKAEFWPHEEVLGSPPSSRLLF